MISSIAIPPFGVEISPAKFLEIYKTEIENILHKSNECANQYCIFHNPSDHHMKEWPITIRLDRIGGLCERVCEHGTGHPDPDSLAYVITLPNASKYEGVHGCDGCCNPRD